jgi:methylglutaconyl-CoA hydratase
VVDDTTALDAAISELIDQIKTSGPQAVAECKKLIAHVASHDLIDAVPYTIEVIATRRVSEEGQAGMNAFLKKDKPPWVSKS